MSERERAALLLEQVPENKLYYVIGFLEGVTVPDETPNAETIAAMQELENGGGEIHDTLEDFFESLEG